MESNKISYIQSLLNGDLLRSQRIRKQYKLILLIVGLIFLYILSGYLSIKQQHKLTDLKKEVRDKKFEYLTISVEHTTLTRSSKVAQMLNEQGSTIQENRKAPIQLVE